jgi:prolyl-tRNA synthetase
MRQSRHFGLTLKDDPRDARTAAHRLLLRAGYVRQIAPGVHAHMPFMRRVLDRIAGLVAAELDANSWEQLRLPNLRPEDLLGHPGPSDGGNFVFKDRRGNVLGLGGGGEAVLAHIAKKEIRSHKDLPRRIFQVGIRFSDEARTRRGMVDEREFLLAEAFSLDAGEEGLKASHRAANAAFQSVLKCLELDYRCAEAELGSGGGCTRQAFVAVAESGDEALVACDACGYSALSRVGQSRLETFPQDAEIKPMEAVCGPGLVGVGPLAEFIGIPVWKTTKTLLFAADERIVAVMVRGDCDVDEDKVKAFLGCRELALADPRVIMELTGAEVGYAGGVGLPAGVTVLADHFTRERVNFECGANRTDYHNINVNWGRDLPLPTFGDFKTARAGELCARCDQGRLREMRGIAVGGLVRLGTSAAATVGLTFQGASGGPQPVHMGAFRLNLSRLSAAVVEQHHDESGIRWPVPAAPFHVHLVALNLEDAAVRAAAEETYRRLLEEKVEVLFDDRDARAGEKFSDSDLIGIPVRLTISKRTFREGRLELKLRSSSASESVTVEKALKTIHAACG